MVVGYQHFRKPPLFGETEIGFSWVFHGFHLDELHRYSFDYRTYMGLSKNRGIYPKMDGNHTFRFPY